MKPSDIIIDWFGYQGCNYDIKTIGNNQISFSNNSFFLQILALIETHLEISALTNENYLRLKQIWKDNGIKLGIYAYNNFKKTDPVMINVEWEDEEKKRLSDPKIWLIIGFSCLAVIVIITITIVIYCKKKKIDRKKEYNEEGLVLEEFKARL